MRNVPDRQFLCLLLPTALACLAALAGCNRGPAVAQVSGIVRFKDGAAPKAGVRVVQFLPADDTTAEIRKAASGDIQDDGSFELYTRMPGDGVYHGKYDVTFSIWKGPHEPVSLISEKYTSTATTPYQVTVDGDLRDLEFEIEP